MKGNEEGRERARRDPEVLKKLDGGLRRLVRMTDDEILEALEVYKARREQELEQFKQMVQAPSPEAAESEEGDQLTELYRAPLLPHALWDVVIVDKVEPVAIKSRAIVQFNGNRDDLLGLGLEVRSQAHDVFTITGTLDQLADLAAEPATERVRLPRCSVMPMS
jgi:hypothetical protein